MTHINHLREQREKNQQTKQNKTERQKKPPRLQLLKTWLSPDMEPRWKIDSANCIIDFEDGSVSKSLRLKVCYVLLKLTTSSGTKLCWGTLESTCKEPRALHRCQRVPAHAHSAQGVGFAACTQAICPAQVHQVEHVHSRHMNISGWPPGSLLTLKSVPELCKSAVLHLAFSRAKSRTVSLSFSSGLLRSSKFCRWMLVSVLPHDKAHGASFTIRGTVQWNLDVASVSHNRHNVLPCKFAPSVAIVKIHLRALQSCGVLNPRNFSPQMSTRHMPQPANSQAGPENTVQTGKNDEAAWFISQSGQELRLGLRHLSFYF